MKMGGGGEIDLILLGIHPLLGFFLCHEICKNGVNFKKIICVRHLLDLKNFLAQKY